MNATAAAILLLTGLSGPQNGEELLPAPKMVRQVVRPQVPLGFYRPSAYDVWQLYGVGQNGFFRARVIENSDAAFYLADGEPYPWASVHMRNYVP